MSILQSFPTGRTPRPQQVHTLQRIEELWDSTDVFVVDAPTGTGKSLIAQTIARWSLKQHKKMARIITSSNILVEQYTKDFPYLHTLPAAHSFTCKDSVETHEATGTVLYSHSCAKQKSRGEKVYCPTCPYLKAKKAGYARPYGIYNYYTYTSNKYYRPVLILDEAHNSMQTLRDLNGKKYWQKDWGYPSTVKTYGQLFSWVKSAIDRHTGESKARLEFLLKELISNRTRYVVERTVEDFKGEPSDVIKLLPVDVSNFGGLLWPAKKVEKIILLSATINRKDIESLGLDKKRVTFITTPSPIPKENRPIYLDCSINLSQSHQASNISAIVEWIKNKLKENPERGIIHCTYSLARMLKLYLEDEPRLMWHDSQNKNVTYEEFLRRDVKEGTVLMASGLYEGIDLQGDLGRWQAILKVPFPSLESPAMQHLAEVDGENYANEAIRVIVQAAGRVCRGPEDYGKTFILDSSFRKLYSDYRELFPHSFQEAVIE